MCSSFNVIVLMSSFMLILMPMNLEGSCFDVPWLSKIKRMWRTCSINHCFNVHQKSHQNGSNRAINTYVVPLLHQNPVIKWYLHQCLLFQGKHKQDLIQYACYVSVVLINLFITSVEPSNINKVYSPSLWLMYKGTNFRGEFEFVLFNGTWSQ